MKKTVCQASKSHDLAMGELYRDKPDVAQQVLNEFADENDLEGILLTLRQMALVAGGLETLAKSSSVTTSTV
jgi:DNA-binding phage protein